MTYSFGNLEKVHWTVKRPLLLCQTSGFPTAFGKKQRVEVKGKLFCGDKPASKVTVKIIERDTIKDDTLAKQETKEDGSFHLDGTDDEIGTIEPELKIYHRCNSKHICKRRWIIKIPDKYIHSPGSTGRIFDIGSVNLEIHLKEDKKCLPA
uniref:Transthyretin/hydroxyisourate hydrolase domain-containing protein n=1 Tax=Trichuris muris TaxID=70415 RepID=A0A5S6Q1Y0_TRIMR